MPEAVEIEIYRRAIDRCLNRTIAAVSAPDAWYLKNTSASALESELIGRTFTGTTRIGKLLCVHISGAGSDLGLRFGMTGRPVVDGSAAIDDLLYTSNDYKPQWVRFALAFSDNTRLEIVDPRRLGGIFLGNDLRKDLGIDIARVTPKRLEDALDGASSPIKAALLNQSRIAGIGNLLADEVLWHAAIAPNRMVPTLSNREIAAIATTARSTFSRLLNAGGSHLGDHVELRHRDARCPKRACNGSPLRRATIGGRTTYWCPNHQR